MKILETSVYRGPNVYALFPVIRHKIDIGVLEDWPSGRLGDAFVEDGLLIVGAEHSQSNLASAFLGECRECG